MAIEKKQSTGKRRHNRSSYRTWIPGENWANAFQFVDCFQNCKFCRSLFYHSPNDVQYHSNLAFICVHCASRGTPSDEQGIYLSLSVIRKDFHYASEWYETCACCRTKFFVTKAPSKKTVVTNKVSLSGKAFTKRVKMRGVEHFCDRCVATKDRPAKTPADFGLDFAMTKKMAKHVLGES